MVNRLATAYQIPVTEVLLKIWLEALEGVDDLQLAHSVMLMFLRNEVARPANKVGWMPTPEEFFQAYKLDKETRRKIEKSKVKQLPEPERKRVPMPPEMKALLAKLTEKWSVKQTRSG